MLFLKFAQLNGLCDATPPNKTNFQLGEAGGVGRVGVGGGVSRSSAGYANFSLVKGANYRRRHRHRNSAEEPLGRGTFVVRSSMR